ncbi:MAG: molybdopterin-dependent oxidoreductase [Candidatus Nitrohelix vancouverensis]|uniref:Molybdopterin-dependent oxidoreductase n=1 Tax=Candidatus Nitrohelix vancouverensis TaxID=2705534 RepID=A0A7T0C318_9BACT|nr:MAG: molybdopterin-dependent oxidoreductase [Candidatus Nitrohelix vancouverensis]
MSVIVRKTVNFTINGKAASAPEGTIIIETIKNNDMDVTNLCYNRKLKPFAACRTCMVEVTENGKKDLVYSCTHPVSEGMEIKVNTEETDRYNKANIEMLLVEHPLDCPICDKSGVCPLQDNTEMLELQKPRFEIQRRNEPSLKSNPLIEFYLNRCIVCGLCVRACDEIQGVQALDFHQRGYKAAIGTANDEPLDCEFCGQCITVCPTGALMDMSSQARGLAALFNNTHTTCNYCSWGCTVQVESKKGQAVRITADETLGVGINEGNLCAKGRFGHGIIHNENRIQSPLINQGGTFTEISWEEALKMIAQRVQTTINRSGPGSVAGLGSEKLTNEENYLFQKLYRELYGSNQINNLQNIQAPYVNQFMIDCFENGIESKPVTDLDTMDVVLVFNSDLPCEYPVGGNSIRKGAIFSKTGIIYANPRNVRFDNESLINIRLIYSQDADTFIANRLSRILIDENLIDVAKAQSQIPNFNALMESLAPYTAEATKKVAGIDNELMMRAARQFAKKADRAILIGNDVLSSGFGQATLNALLNLSILVHAGGEGSVSIYPPREHCNSQGVNDMGVTPQFLPGYRPVEGELKKQADLASDLFENCSNGKIKFLHILGEDPLRSHTSRSSVENGLQTVPFLVVQDSFMSDTARMADLVLPTTSFAERDGTYTNMTRHVQRVAPAIRPQGASRTDFDILMQLAEALGKPFKAESTLDVQDEIAKEVPCYQGLFPGNKYLQWKPQGFAAKPEFKTSDFVEPQKTSKEFPLKLLSNNHMFHIGNYSHYAKALVDIGPSCIAEINSKDAQKADIQSGDKILVESKQGRVEVEVKTSSATPEGMVYIPKNWPEVPVNTLRNGDQNTISVKISKAN